MTSTVLALLATACLGEPGESRDSPEEGAPGTDGIATLTVTGDGTVAPGTHTLTAGCQYARGTRSVQLTSYSEEPAERRPRAGLINLWTMPASRDLGGGALAGRFEYNEIRADGTVPTHFGPAEITVRIVDDSRPSIWLLEIQGEGESEDGGVRVELSATCSALVTG